jgi:shikimate dehydrogenase
VNTIVNDGGVLTGYNTDYVAVRDLLVARAIDPATPFVLRGSGAWPRRWPPPCMTLVSNRDHRSAQ